MSRDVLELAGSLGYLDELSEQFLEQPGGVDASWHELLETGAGRGSGQGNGNGQPMDQGAGASALAAGTGTIPAAAAAAAAVVTASGRTSSRAMRSGSAPAACKAAVTSSTLVCTA
ncbi:MAG: hypothetical protein M3680_23000, partial [Myxococcota bacterium]|nr:hypothetical protein [Myxococcota bacterium]